ncbi:hypothetical protein DEHALATV1_0215 [Dehalococcoides mccartyi]|uniref:Antitoxin n=3 Tax=root TaxID=1 RepID=A0AB33HND3_9CHLR|nr:hypothetical protein DEHALATV1_0215 [Dehalococcoides mccartyi]
MLNIITDVYKGDYCKLLTLCYIMSQMGHNNKSGKTIRLGSAALDRLDKLRHKGQSYDGLITELLDLHESETLTGQKITSSKRTRSDDEQV